MSSATGLENAGRMSLGWAIAIAGTGLMIASLIAGFVLQLGSDAEVPSRAAVRNAAVPEPTADYGIRHIQRSEARTMEATADYGIRHMPQPVDVRSRARSSELDASADFGTRHTLKLAPRFTPEVDYGIRHPQRIVRPLAPEDDYGVRNTKVPGR